MKKIIKRKKKIKKKKNEEPKKKGWLDLLKNYVKDTKKPTKYEQEEKTTKLFLEILESDKNKKINSNEKIPRFYFKKPTNFSDLNITLKNEAKQKYLIIKSYDFPSKKDLKINYQLLQLKILIIILKKKIIIKKRKKQTKLRTRK